MIPPGYYDPDQEKEALEEEESEVEGVRQKSRVLSMNPTPSPRFSEAASFLLMEEKGLLENVKAEHISEVPHSAAQ